MALALAGCGGKKAAPPKEIHRSPDAIADAYIKAAASGRFGPNLQVRFRSFSHGYTRVVSERVTDQFGVVAIRRGQAVDAIVMHRHGGIWTVDFRSPISIQPLGPKPTSRARVDQVAAELRRLRGRNEAAVLYVDGAALESKLTRTGGHATLFANLLSPLAPGEHSAVVFATDGLTATARAWTFTATK